MSGTADKLKTAKAVLPKLVRLTSSVNQSERANAKNMTGGENHTNLNHKFEEENVFASQRFSCVLSMAISSR